MSRAWNVSDDLTRIRAKVRGSASKPYRVDVQLDFDGGRLADLHGECSCPMMMNCKHVVATMLEALREEEPSAELALPRAREQAPSVAARPPILSLDVNIWIENVGKAVRDDNSPAEMNQRLLYRLHPSHEGVQMPMLVVSLLSVRVQKGGEFGGSLTHPSVSDFMPERAAKYYRAIDIDILTQLSGRFRSYDYRQTPQRAELLDKSSRRAARFGSITSDRR